MPRDISDSSSRKKDKLSQDKLRDYRKSSDAAEESSKRKSSGKSSAEGGKSSKKGEASGYSSGQKRQYLDHADNCFASEFDFEDSPRPVQNNTRLMQHPARNGLVLPVMSNKHSLVDYDDESSDSDSSSDSSLPQSSTGKAVRRKSSVQVVSACLKADMNDIQQQSHKPDTTIVRHVRMSSSSGQKQSSTDSVNYDERSDKKKRRHSPVELREPESTTKDIPVRSPKRRHMKDHRSSRCDYDLNVEDTNSKKTQFVDRPEKTSDVKKVSKEKDTKRAKKLDTENEVAASSVHTEKSKGHKKSKNYELSDDGGLEQKSRVNIPKQSIATAAMHKKEKSQKVSHDGHDHSKTSQKTDRQKKVDSHSDSINGAKSSTHYGFSVQQLDRVKHISDDHPEYSPVRKKHEKEKHSSEKKQHAADDSDSDNDKKKKEKQTVKEGGECTSSKGDKVKNKRKKDKLHRSKNERELSDEGQISSDSSSGRLKESKRRRQSHVTLRNGSNTPVRTFSSASASLRKATSSER